MEKNQIIIMAKELMNQHMPNHVKLGWRFQFNNRKKAFGLCSYRTQTIELSNHYATLMKEDGVKETLLHEIAHALTPNDKGHGDSWKRKYIELGGSGLRTATFKEKFDSENLQKAIHKAKYIYECPICNNQFPFHKRLKYSRACLCNQSIPQEKRIIILKTK